MSARKAIVLPGLAPIKLTHNASPLDQHPCLDPKLFQNLPHFLSGFKFLESDFGMPVKFPAKIDDNLFQSHCLV